MQLVPQREANIIGTPTNVALAVLKEEERYDQHGW